jgi:predicted nucleotidyltransferase
LIYFSYIFLGNLEKLERPTVAVDFEPGRSLLDHGGLIADFEEYLGCKVDVLIARGIRERIRARVEKTKN